MIVAISGKIGSGKDTVAKMIQGISIGLRKDHTIRTLRNTPDIPFEDLFFVKWEVHKLAGILKELVAKLTGQSLQRIEKREVKESFAPEEWNYTLEDAKEYLTLQWQAGKTILALDDERWIRQRATELGFQWRRTFRDMMVEIANLIRDQYHPQAWALGMMAEYREYHRWLVPDWRYPDEAEVFRSKTRNPILVRVNRPGTGNHPQSKNVSETALDNYKGFDVVIENDADLEELYDKVLEMVTQFKLHENAKCSSEKAN